MDVSPGASPPLPGWLCSPPPALPAASMFTEENAAPLLVPHGEEKRRRSSGAGRRCSSRSGGQRWPAGSRRSSRSRNRSGRKSSSRLHVVHSHVGSAERSGKVSLRSPDSQLRHCRGFPAAAEGRGQLRRVPVPGGAGASRARSRPAGGKQKGKEGHVRPAGREGGKEGRAQTGA